MKNKAISKSLTYLKIVVFSLAIVLTNIKVYGQEKISEEVMQLSKTARAYKETAKWILNISSRVSITFPFYLTTEEIESLKRYHPHVYKILENASATPVAKNHLTPTFSYPDVNENNATRAQLNNYAMDLMEKSLVHTLAYVEELKRINTEEAQKLVNDEVNAVKLEALKSFGKQVTIMNLEMAAISLSALTAVAYWFSPPAWPLAVPVLSALGWSIYEIEQWRRSVKLKTDEKLSLIRKMRAK